MLKALVACEYSGRVREALKKRGWYAVSCDLLPSEIEGNHYQGNVIDILYEDWDMLIAFPPCTYLTASGNRWIPNNPERWEKRLAALKFVHTLMNAPIAHIGLENPVGAISSYIRRPDQIIHPYHFGDPVAKQTCLWLKNLPILDYTNVVEPDCVYYNSKSKKNGKSRYSKELSRLSGNGLARSKTYPGVAEAMAEQWTKYINDLYLI